uniref:Uncharacterized protein n=1 Tax=Arundo donax TaxID=35708 RepID=A0A0A9GI42_ARUDO
MALAHRLVDHCNTTSTCAVRFPLSPSHVYGLRVIWFLPRAAQDEYPRNRQLLDQQPLFVHLSHAHHHLPRRQC